MYEAFFGLNEKPFNLTPDPRFLYLSDKHREAFAHLKYAIQNRTGFVMVSGEVGTGKTTICRSLLNQLDPDTELAFIFNPMLSPRELLRSINDDFGIQRPTGSGADNRGDSIKELIDELNEYLVARNAEGKNCVLVIDEAQNLRPEVLEQVRLLSNLETETQKLLQIVLIGQPELAENLELPQLRQLNQRITARYHLKPLSKKETLQYIAYRLRVAAGRGKVRFSRGAVGLVHKLSGGTPRVINAICDRALLVGYTKETRYISSRIVRQAAHEIRGPRVKARRRAAPWVTAASEPARGQLDLFPELGKAAEMPPRRWLPRPIAALVIVAILFGVWYVAAGPGRTLSREGVTLPAPTKTVSALSQSRPIAPTDLGGAIAVVVPPKTVSPEPPKPEPPAPSCFLDALDPEQARVAAAQAILDAWDLKEMRGELRGDSWQDLIAFGRTNRLDCCLLHPSVDQLLAINLPALVRMAGDNQSLWLGLVGVQDDAFELTTVGTDTVALSRDGFQKRFGGEAVILWKDPTPDAPTLAPSMSGEAVAQLQKNLQALGRYAGPPSGVYDEATAEAVAKIQAETGLREDGMAGKNVRMVLCSWWLSGISTPSLRPAASFEGGKVPPGAERLAEGLPVAAPAAEPGTSPEEDAAKPESPEALLAEALPPAAETTPETSTDESAESLDNSDEMPASVTPGDDSEAPDTASPQAPETPSGEDTAGGAPPAPEDASGEERTEHAEEPPREPADTSNQPDSGDEPGAEVATVPAAPESDAPQEEESAAVREEPIGVPERFLGAGYLLVPDLQPGAVPQNGHVHVEELPPPGMNPAKEVTPPLVATSPLVPRESADAVATGQGTGIARGNQGESR